MYKFFLLLWISLTFNQLGFSESPFVVIIASYNNQPYAKKNILSVLNQNYTNFRVIYIDDHSTDKTLFEATHALKDHPKKEKVEFFRNRKNLGAMENHYHAIHRCKRDEICVILDGDDWFSSQDALKILDSYYQNPNCWMTWGSYLEFPQMRLGSYSKKAEINDLVLANLRKKPWQTSHLRSFYAGLFHRIKKQDLQMNGKFVPVCCDVAEMIPLLEMARERAFFVPEILYIYNTANPISDSKVNYQLRSEVLKKIYDSAIYPKLNQF